LGGGAANASGGYEVDEEGFSIQPAKEIAWEEGHDKCKPRVLTTL